MLGFFTIEIWQIAQERNRKARSKKASCTFGRNLRPKHANRIPRRKVGVSLVVISKLPQRGLITTLREWIANDRSALNNELKLGEDNSDPIKVHPELSSISSPRPSVHDLTQNFGREHANAPNRTLGVNMPIEHTIQVRASSLYIRVHTVAVYVWADVLREFLELREVWRSRDGFRWH